jgi:hypothetical protein
VRPAWPGFGLCGGGRRLRPAGLMQMNHPAPLTTYGSRHTLRSKGTDVNDETAHDLLADRGSDQPPQRESGLVGGLASGSDRDESAGISSSRRWHLAHPEAKKAYEIFNEALRVGLLKRPGHCTICLRTCIPHGHHGDYSQPLSVLWVCNPCHRSVHRILNGRRAPRKRIFQSAVPFAASVLGKKGGAAGKGASKRRGDAAYYRALAKKSAAARRAKAKAKVKHG